MTHRATAFAVAVLLCVAVVASRAEDISCPYAPSTPGDRREDKSVLKIAAYNAEWLFDNGYSSSHEHVEEVVAVLADLNADIVSFEEVQGCEILWTLCNMLDAGYKPYLIKGTDTSTGQNVGLITKVDIATDMVRTEARWDYPLPNNDCGYSGSSGTYGVSKHYLTTFDLGGETLAMVGLHFLAFPTASDRCAKREAQASVLRSAINGFLAAGDSVVVLGDYNDYSDDVPDVADDIPNSRVVRILRDGLIEGTGSGSSSTSESASYPPLYEVANEIIQSQRYSSFYGTDSYSQIDHILVSADLVDRIQDAGIDHAYAPGTVSDHWPIYVQIATPSTSSSSSSSWKDSGDGAPAPQVDDSSDKDALSSEMTGITMIVVVVVAIAFTISIGLLAAIYVLEWRKASEAGYTTI